MQFDITIFRKKIYMEEISKKNSVEEKAKNQRDVFKERITNCTRESTIL